MNKEQIAKLLLILSGAFQNYQTNETTLETWHMTLKDCNYEHASKAVFDYIREGNAFAPQPGQIYQRVINVWKSERRKNSFKELPMPEISPEEKARNLEKLRQLSEDIAAKKAMRQ